MDYKQTLDYLYNKLPMFSHSGGLALKPGFANIISLCRVLGNPQLNRKFIHVAGTNGKGSVSHTLASILQSAGYKTGLYTSPHLKDFRERIKINGQMISEGEVVGFIDRMKPLIESIEPSFFEITVAMAFHHFEEKDVDIAIIETGLGGRLDSTNIITPQLSVITNIGYDHVQILGDTLEKIAYEKAGIIKHHVPVVIGEKKPATADVFIAKATEMQCPIFFAEDYFRIENWKYENEELIAEVQEKGKTDHQKYHLGLSGQYQLKNLLTVLETCKQLPALGFEVKAEDLYNGIRLVKKQTGLHGRWETIQQQPRIVLDVAHNKNGMQELMNQLEITSYHQLRIVIGMVKDKDVDAILQLLPKNAFYYFTNAHIPRALSAGELKAKAALYGLDGNSFENVNISLSEAKAHAHKDDLILVCGSVFLVGEVQ